MNELLVDLNAFLGRKLAAAAMFAEDPLDALNDEIGIEPRLGNELSVLRLLGTSLPGESSPEPPTARLLVWI